MYTTLKAELSRRHSTQKELAKNLNITGSALSLKMCGKTKFTLDEAFRTKKFLGVDMPLDELFVWEQ